MISDDTELNTLARALGIQTEYWDIAGVLHHAPQETLEALVQALGGAALATPQIATGEDATALPALPVLPPVIVINESEERVITLAAARHHTLSQMEWRLTAEDGTEWRGLLLPRGHHDGKANGAIHAGNESGLVLPLPAHLKPGYYRLDLISTIPLIQPQTGTVIVAPAQAYLPPAVSDGRRAWGIQVQLYALRSPRNWGIGDFTDLRTLAEKAAGAGAAAIGLNPLHALYLDEPGMACPYWPNSRLFLNPLYIDVEAVPHFADCADAVSTVTDPAFQARLAHLRAPSLVNYDGVAAAKLTVLELLFAHFCAHHLCVLGNADAAAFQAFREAHGEDLRRFSTFAVIREVLRRQDPSLEYWRNWPQPLQDPASPEVAAFAAQHAQAVLFQDYLQWIADGQLSACARAARDRGMGIGLYKDLAVGAGDAAAETWGARTMLMEGWSIGAPPDPFGPLGQDWGSMAMRPSALAASAYAPYITLLRANMRHAGALRIDHILGFVRLFLVPRGRSPADGTYVQYPLHDLLAILRLESQRAQCLVIGEDLGTVPEGLSEAMRAGGIFSYRLLYFTRDHQNRFLPPQAYPPNALVAAGTHDLPPLSGWWNGADIGERERLGFYAHDEGGPGREHWIRGESRGLMMEALGAQGLPLEGDGGAPVEAVHRFLARSPSRLMMLSFEDILGVADQVNVPGTTDSHPNWRRKLPCDLDTLFADERVQRILDAVYQERG